MPLLAVFYNPILTDCPPFSEYFPVTLFATSHIDVNNNYEWRCIEIELVEPLQR